MNATTARRTTANRLSALELRERWRQMLHDPLLAAIPYKLELTEKGTIEVSPATTRHAFVQAFVAGELRRLAPEGTTFTECPIETGIGVRVPDVAWASAEYLRRHGMPSMFLRAPELCIEVLSPSNTSIEMSEKVAAYLAAGAREVWLVNESGAIEVFDENGSVPSSRFGIELAIPSPQ